MKTKYFSLLTFLIALVFSACSSTYKVPMARMASPETEGKQEASLQVGLHQLHSVTITTDISNIPVSKSTHEAEPKTTVGGNISFGLLDRVDIGADIELSVIPMLLARFQVLGESKRKAEQGNFSFTLLAGVGHEAANTDDGSGIFQNPGTPGTNHRDASTLLEAGAVMGYRTSPNLLIFAGTSVLWQTVQGNQTLGSGGAAILYVDHSRYTEMHGAGYFTFEANTGRTFFFTPSVQWGWSDSFGNRNYLTAVQADLGVQL